MGFLAEVAVEAFDRIVCQENIGVSVSVDLLTGKGICIGRYGWIEAHPYYVDSFASEVELFARWMLLMQKVDVSGSCVHCKRGGSLLCAAWRIVVAAYEDGFDILLM